MNQRRMSSKLETDRLSSKVNRLLSLLLSRTAELNTLLPAMPPPHSLSNETEQRKRPETVLTEQAHKRKGISTQTQ